MTNKHPDYELCEDGDPTVKHLPIDRAVLSAVADDVARGIAEGRYDGVDDEESEADRREADDALKTPEAAEMHALMRRNHGPNNRDAKSSQAPERQRADTQRDADNEAFWSAPPTVSSAELERATKALSERSSGPVQRELPPLMGRLKGAR